MSHDGTATNIFTDIFHIFFALLDRIIYSVIQGVYNVFFSVSTSTILDGSIVRVLYQRVQLILGIFMIFKLALSILNLIINPDLMKDKNSGTGKIVMRVVICLMLLTVVVPLNIPGAKPRTLNGYINDHGILFGTLYAVQDRVLRENIIAKLILGYATTDVSGDDEAPDATVGGALDNAGNMLATNILKSFVVVNVKDDTLEDVCGGDDASCPNVYCVREVQESGYLDAGATVGTIMDTVNLKCDADGSKYAFRYMIPFSTIVGCILIFVLVGYTIDVAIRAFKLMFLRIIAPIPIISYVDPKSSKDGAFASWVKTLTSTYIDLFLRLAIIYFVIFVIAVISQQGLSSISIGSGGFATKTFTYVFIVIGLLFFARQAPSFIKTMLGAKGVGFGPGVSGALGFVGGLTARGGITGALAAGSMAASATNDAQAQGKAGPGAWGMSKDIIRKMQTGDKDARGDLPGRAAQFLEYNARNRVLDNMGLSRRNQALADANKKQLQTQYGEAERAFDIAQINVRNQGISEASVVESRQVYERAQAEYDRYTSTPGFDIGRSAELRNQVEQARNKYEGQQSAWNEYLAAYDKKANLSIAAQKAAKNAEEIDKIRNQMGTSPRIGDKYRATHRSALNYENGRFSRDAGPFNPYKGNDNNHLVDDERIYGGGHQGPHRH